MEAQTRCTSGSSSAKRNTASFLKILKCLFGRTEVMTEITALTFAVLFLLMILINAKNVRTLRRANESTKQAVEGWLQTTERLDQTTSTLRRTTELLREARAMLDGMGIKA
jgi:hypothetical protein